MTDSTTRQKAWRFESYAFGLLRRLRAGESVSELAASEGIPESRIELRLRAAQLCESQRTASPSGFAFMLSRVRVPESRHP